MLSRKYDLKKLYNIIKIVLYYHIIFINYLQEKRESQDDRGGQGEDGHDEPDPDVSRKPLNDTDHHEGLQRNPSKRNYDDHEHHVS